MFIKFQSPKEFKSETPKVTDQSQTESHTNTPDVIP